MTQLIQTIQKKKKKNEKTKCNKHHGIWNIHLDLQSFYNLLRAYSFVNIFSLPVGIKEYSMKTMTISMKYLFYIVFSIFTKFPCLKDPFYTYYLWQISLNSTQTKHEANDGFFYSFLVFLLVKYFDFVFFFVIFSWFFFIWFIFYVFF